MARQPNVLSDIQRDTTAFRKIKRTIDRIGQVNLTKYGKTTRPTIAKYVNKEPVNPGSEAGILESIRLYMEDKEKERQAAIAQSSQLYEMAEAS